MSREIQQSNKAPRHHNDNFESDKRFIETVAELRIMYNLGAIGVIFLSISSGLELVQRYAETYYPFLALLIACVINFLPNYKHMNIYLKKMIQLICYVFIVYKFILFIQPLSHEAFMCYVWNYWLSPQATFNLY